MRYINTSGFIPNTTWSKRANTEAAALKTSTPKDRDARIKKNEGLWKELKASLKSLSHNKCWYCESIDDRSDNAVDHYRPKGNVCDANPPHEGYWWLAFDWHNYRFSCTLCNSIRSAGGSTGGKQDHFPLANEAHRARSHDAVLEREDPLLLDPTNPLDARLIAFADDGSAGPAVARNEDPTGYLKGKESVLRYHLNQRDILERRFAVIQQVRGWLEQADRYLDIYETSKDSGDALTRECAAQRLRDIIKAFAPESPYSSAVRHYLAGMRQRSKAAFAALS